MSHKLDLLPVDDTEEPWYKEGLHFKCTECGECCTGAPGYVWVAEDEIAEMAKFLSISTADFMQKYVRSVDGRYSLIEDTKTFDCVFLKNKKCQLYTARPIQCKTFPWWPSMVRSKKDWEDSAAFCEGINPLAPCVSYEEITSQLQKLTDLPYIS